MADITLARSCPYTSMALVTVWIPHSLNHRANRCRSAVKHPKTRTGSAAPSGPTAT